MNAERLHRIILEIDEELEQVQTEQTLEQLSNALQNMINSPTTPQYQTDFNTIKEKFLNSLELAASNQQTPIWWQTADEIGASPFLGRHLKQRIELIFARHQITPAAALEEIKALSKEVKDFSKAINSTIAGLTILNIGVEDLDTGECEITYSIPRSYVDESLKTFHKEVGELNFILSRFSELVTGTTEEFRIQTISSSDFALYIAIGIPLAKFLAEALDKILQTYKTILEIRKLKDDLKSKGVSDKETKGIDAHVNSLMSKQIEAIVTASMERYAVKEKLGHRANEVENGLVSALNKLANRIDKGFQLTIRVEPIEKDEDEDNQEEVINDELSKDIVEIATTSQRINYLQNTGSSILQLPENTEATLDESDK